MNSLDVHTIALQMKAVQDDGLQIEPFTSRLGGFDVSAAYEVAHLIHEARIDEGIVSADGVRVDRWYRDLAHVMF